MIRGDDGGFDEVQGTIDVAHDGKRLLAVASDNNPVGTHEILNRGSLAQKFGVRDHVEGNFGQSS